MAQLMYIPFTCPHCGAFTEVETEYAGQTGPCYACGKSVTVPYAAPSAGATVASRPAGASLATIGSILALVACGMVALIGLLALLMWIMGPAISGGAAVVQKSACQSNLKQIGIALEQYHLQYGAYPPAYVVDSKGKRMHSWRVLILPFLGEHGLYAQYNLNEPWDSPNNMTVANRMPSVFGCPSDLSAEENGETSYFVVVGKGTAFTGANAVKKTQFTDKFSETVLVVESHSSGIGWTEPKDLDASQMLFLINGGTGKGGGAQEIMSRHMGGAHVLTADNETHFLRDDTPAEHVEALLTISGKDYVPPEVLGKDDDPFEP